MRFSAASIARVLELRLRAQLLTGPPARTPLAVAERLLAIQAQDPRGARLAIRARSAGVVAADVDRALTDERALVISWLNRGTLHLVPSEHFHWLHELTTPPLRPGNARRLAQEGVSPRQAERGVQVIERALVEAGPQTRLQLRHRLDEAGVPTAGQALVHLLMLATLRGVAVRGPMVGREHAYALVRDWLPAPAPFDRARALAELARRFLAGHGPADERDLAKWAGIPLRDARAGLQAIAVQLRASRDGLVDLAKRPRAAGLPPPRLLGAFEPVLMGWRSRAPVLGASASQVVTGGVFRPFAYAGGRTVATWKVSAGSVILQPLADIAEPDAEALAREAEAVIGFLALPGPASRR